MGSGVGRAAGCRRWRRWQRRAVGARLGGTAVGAAATDGAGVGSAVGRGVGARATGGLNLSRSSQPSATPAISVRMISGRLVFLKVGVLGSFIMCGISIAFISIAYSIQTHMRMRKFPPPELNVIMDRSCRGRLPHPRKIIVLPSYCLGDHQLLAHP